MRSILYSLIKVENLNFINYTSSLALIIILLCSYMQVSTVVYTHIYLSKTTEDGCSKIDN